MLSSLALNEVIALTPSPIEQGVFGIILTISLQFVASEIVLQLTPAIIEIIHLAVLFLNSDTIDLNICGFTAKTTYSQEDITSALLFEKSILQYFSFMLGVDINISFSVNNLLARSPLIIAFAILPHPIKPNLYL